ncbi:YitT family protein [Anaerocolumna sp. AGMB13020]|uniref:YitT family protein n=1 Tax=Anaerocolumna sp. AGMB13020 TaxID=3081750 RepID=UPI002954B1DF|nr:YitT family protein [Anaerocolumna sp. AGMB13020]WOO39157.1 YitT family protein [Anaerocolumna sp. AGMB13020]
MKKKLVDNLKEYLLISAGVELVVLGVYFFKFPNNFSIGGVTGLAILLSSLLGPKISTSTVVFVINMILLVVGYLVIGRSFGNKTAYGSILMSASLSLLEYLFPLKGPLTNEPMLELAFAVLLPAVGAAILFNIGASTGGTDVVAMILKKYSNIDIGRSLFITDLFLTLASFLIFDITTGLLSLLGLLVKSTMVDTIIENLNLHKYLTIICKDPKPISDFILNTLHRSATISDAKGAFSNQEKKIIFAVMNRSQAVQLRRFIKETEPDAFILITNTSEIVGRGFRA